MPNLNEIINYITSKLGLLGVNKFNFYYNLGVNAYQKKDYNKALKYFMKSLEQSGIKPQVYYNLALTHQSREELDSAKEFYIKFLELKPNDYEGLFNLALTYYSIKDFPNAVKYFEKCTEIKEEANVIKTLAFAYLDNNETNKAFEASQKILKKYSYGAKLCYEIAKAFENKNFPTKDFTFIDTAIKIYESIIKKDKTYFDAYLSTSICYAKKGEWEKSVEFCAKALSLNSKSYEANIQMGLVCYCFDALEDAIKYYEKAFKVKPNGEHKIYSNLGYAYEKNGDYNKAINIFSELVDKFPDIPAKDEIKNHLRILKDMNQATP